VLQRNSAREKAGGYPLRRIVCLILLRIEKADDRLVQGIGTVKDGIQALNVVASRHRKGVLTQRVTTITS
jgi:hypothetical protein